jgi:electron-transferring-flavoprotein dehydrogenase
MSFEELPANVTREVMEVDVLIVGGGSAGLSAAYHLKKQIDSHNTEIQLGKRTGNLLEEPMIVVLEKAIEVGAQSLSGAVLNPIALRELFPDYIEQNCPLESEVKEDAVYYLTDKSSIKLPITPPPFQNKGNYIISLSKFNRWLGKKCEDLGINIFPGFAAVEALYDGDKIIGVRTGDKGRDKNGIPKSNFEPGLILKSKVTVFAEGTRGSLFRQVQKKLGLNIGKNAEAYEEGVKEIIQMPTGTVTAGQVIHTMGYPLKKSVGGTFIYTLPEDKIALGLVAYLDTEDPLLDPHRELQKLKTHPFIYNMIKGGKVVAYGGKTLPAGGWYSMPKLYGNGFLVCGDTASMVNVQKLKGIHLAMKSGMLAAETVYGALVKSDFSSSELSQYDVKVNKSYIKEELYRVRNFHQTLGMGTFTSLPFIALQELTGGRGLVDKMETHPDYSKTEKMVDVWGGDGLALPENQLPKPDGILFFDKLGSVYLTGTMHDEDSPNHLLLKSKDVCRVECHTNYKSPCTHFCPAAVYEMVPSDRHPNEKELQINYTNCIHCKTCDIKCPFENIDWTTPEGGGGPRYQET